MKEKVQTDLDLQDEDFVTDDELLGYFNEAIDDVEAVIHTLYEDYFLTTATISLVNGTQDYAWPSDIYAQKVRGFFYENGTRKYMIRKIKRIHDIPDIQSDDDLRYIPMNTTATGYKIRFYPTPAETGAYGKLWYIRNAKVLTLDADVCDIPEFANVIMQQVKVRCYEKEGNPNVMKAMADLEAMKKLMVETLTNMVDDEQDHVEMDTEFYDDFDDAGVI
jgi:hypothetical protein